MDIGIIIDDFIKVCELAKINLDKADIKIECLTAGQDHVPTKLPDNHMAVYIFTNPTGDVCYKVGKVGTNSKARYQTQHYSPTSSKTNLAKSILNDCSLNGDADLQTNVGLWIKQNTCRTNLLLSADKGFLTLSLLEVFIQNRLKPIYEGYDCKIRSN